MTGIIHSIILFIDACFGSVDPLVIIFCCTHIEPPTRMGRSTLEGSGSERSSHRKPLFSGIASWTPGTQDQSLWERLTRPSGLLGRAFMMDW